MVRLVYLCGVSVVLWVLDLVVQNGNPKFVEGKDLMNPLICVRPFVCPIIFIILARTSLIFFLNNLFGIARNCGVTFGGIRPGLFDVKTNSFFWLLYLIKVSFTKRIDVRFKTNQFAKFSKISFFTILGQYLGARPCLFDIITNQYETLIPY